MVLELQEEDYMVLELQEQEQDTIVEETCIYYNLIPTHKMF